MKTLLLHISLFFLVGFTLNAYAFEGTGSECGTVSTLQKPPLTKRIYSAFIMSIDGKSVVTGKTQFRLMPGKHVLKVHESGNSRRSKELEVEVEVGKKYHIGAKFIKEKRSSRFKEEYWQPVVWKTSEQECNL